MENLNIRFKNVSIDEDDLLWIFEGLEDKVEIEYYTPYDDKIDLYFDYIEEVKKTILKDFERMLNYQVKECTNNKGLSQEIEILLTTYNQNLDDIEEENFIQLTDHYLLFTNLEQRISKDNNYPKIKTTIIVSRNFKEYYFIREEKTKYEQIKTIINTFKVEGKTIKSKRYSLKEKLNLSLQQEETITGFINSLHDYQYKKKK